MFYMYLNLYLAVTVLVLYPIFCWYTYMDSQEDPKYRHLMVGDMCVLFLFAVVPILNVVMLYQMIKHALNSSPFDRLMSIKVFDGGR